MPTLERDHSVSPGSQRITAEAPLNAISEIIQAIHLGQADVARFATGGHDLYVFFVRRSFSAADGIKHGPQQQPHPRPHPKRWTPAILPGAEYTRIEQIIECACQQAKVARNQLASKSRSKQVALARALIAHYAVLAKTATIAELASMMDVADNSLNVRTRSYRQSNPKFFKKSVEDFLALRKPTAAVSSQQNGKGTAPTGADASDAEIGQRLASALLNA